MEHGTDPSRTIAGRQGWLPLGMAKGMSVLLSLFFLSFFIVGKGSFFVTFFREPVKVLNVVFFCGFLDVGKLWATHTYLTFKDLQPFVMPVLNITAIIAC